MPEWKPCFLPSPYKEQAPFQTLKSGKLKLFFPLTSCGNEYIQVNGHGSRTTQRFNFLKLWKPWNRMWIHETTGRGIGMGGKPGA
jgi:hypothetical protein